MANQVQLSILKQGVKTWNDWRKKNQLEIIDLKEANLSKTNLVYADLRYASLSNADLTNADLSNAFLGNAYLCEANLKEANVSAADLSKANLSEADFRRANLSWADLSNADLSGANLREATLNFADLKYANIHKADLSETNLSEANLSAADLSKAILSAAELTKANLIHANLSAAILRGTNLNGALVNGTVFADVDLSSVRSLELVKHLGPSSLGIDTLLRSGGDLPDSFLEGCGVPDIFIEYLPSLIGKPIDFYSCFISYSHQDEEFCNFLHSRMRADKLRVWYAPEDIKGGKKVHEQIKGAIRLHDKLLIVPSEYSMKSEWVKTEIRQARKRELKEGRRVLFPIRLVPFEMIEDWEAFDTDTGRDMGVEIREYFIPDFTDWKDHDSFSRSYQRLMKNFKPE